MLRTLLILTLFFLPLSGRADAAAIENQVVFQKGFFLDKACLKQKKTNDPCLCEADISYPQYDGLGDGAGAFNATLKSEVLRSVANEGVKPGCEGEGITKKLFDAKVGKAPSSIITALGKTIFTNDTLLTVGIEAYLNHGGAHGYSSMHYLVFDKQKSTLLGVRDILDPAQMQGFNEYLFDTIKNTDGTELSSGDGGADPSKGKRGYDYTQRPDFVWYVNDKGVYAHFGFYSIASYASGTFDFPIPSKFITHPEIQKLAKENHHAS